MEDLFLHIEYLLRHHDCVIVPGLGAFIINTIPAHADSETRQILPPSKEICFNPSVKNNDGMLANSYVRKYRMTFAEATGRITAAVAAIGTTLKEDKEVVIGRIGQLTLNDDTITFTPSVFYRDSNENEGMLPASTGQAADKAAGTDAAEPTDAAGTAVTGRDNDKYYYIAVNKTFAKAAASILVTLVLALSVMLPPLTAEKERNYEKASVIPQTEDIDISSLRKRTTAPARSDADRQTERPERVSKEITRYYLIVATFHTQPEAEKYISSRTERKSLTIAPGKKIFRVASASSDSREELLDELNSPQFKEEFGEGWIWENPN